jgi:hypothetical protein
MPWPERASFDDPNLLSRAGLIPLTALVQRPVNRRLLAGLPARAPQLPGKSRRLDLRLCAHEPAGRRRSGASQPAPGCTAAFALRHNAARRAGQQCSRMNVLLSRLAL